MVIARYIKQRPEKAVDTRNQIDLHSKSNTYALRSQFDELTVARRVVHPVARHVVPDVKYVRGCHGERSKQ